MSAWRTANRPQLAVFYGKQAVNLFQAVRANIAQLEPQTQRAYVQSKESVYRDLADLLVSIGRLPEAQQVLDLLKEQEYRDYVRRTGGTAPREVELTPEEAAWQERYRAIQDRVVSLGRERSELVALRTRSTDENARLAELDADMRVAAQAFQDFLTSLAADLGVANAGERVFQLREAQTLMSDLRELGSGTVALYTIVGEHRYRVILITPDVEKAAEFPISAVDLRRKVQAFREALQNPETDPRPLAQDLYSILIAPIVRDLQQAGAQTLMWSLDDVLRYVPFGALHDGHRYLIERYRNVVFTPATRGSLTYRSQTWQAGLGVGVSKAQEGFQALPAVADELRGIIRDTRVAEATSGVINGHLLLDEAFTEPALRTELRARPPVVHVASHFQFRPGNEEDSFLLLGDGRRLSVADLKTEWTFFKDVDLLTLSACDTAIGSTGANGKEVESFGLLAQRNGARTVIATLWPVADQSTRQLMEDFYRARMADRTLSKGEALRRAQLGLLQGVPTETGRAVRGLVRVTRVPPTSGTAGRAKYSHPYYWAPFLLIGNWR